MRFTQFSLAATFAATFAAAATLPLAAQSSTSRADPERRARAEAMIERSQNGLMRAFSFDSDRAWLGVSTGGGTRRDTLGLLIESVVPGSPADKAGLEEGTRIAAINGVNLRADATDAGEPETFSMLQRRLTRELGKLKPGDEAELRVWGNGQSRTVKVKTGSPDDPFKESRQKIENRAVIGVGLGSTGSKRDTLGVFVASVTEGGPAEKAGIVEGDRIAAIDGTDLRVPREDAGDESVSSSRLNRLQKVLRGKSAGDDVTLRVWSGGRSREVKVKTAKAVDLGEKSRYRFFTGDGEMTFMRIPPMSLMPAMPPMPPMPPMPAMAPRAPSAPLAPTLRGLISRTRSITI